MALALSAWLASSCSEEPPAIDSAVIAGNAFSAQVRQGVGPISIVVTGKGLHYVESAWLEDIPVTVRTGVPDGGVTVDAVIPHGTMPGDRDLTLNLKDNRPILTQARVVEVTTIRATPQGDDMTGRGTPEHPYRSLTRALSLSATGDEVELGAGTYDLVAGERWPAGSGSSYMNPNVPDGVLVKGAGSAVTALDGTGLLVNAAGLVFIGGGSVEGMTLRNLHRGLVVQRGLVNATDVTVTGCTGGEGVAAYGSATVRLTSVGVTGCLSGVHTLGSSLLNVTNSNFTGNGVGLEMDESSRGVIQASGCSGNTGAGVVVATRGDVTLDGMTVDQNGQAGVASSSGVYVTSTPNQLRLRGGTISRNRGAGLYMLGGILDFATTTVTNNRLDGVTLDGASQARLDRAQVTVNDGDGVRVTNAASTSLEVVASTVRSNKGSGITVFAGTASVRSSNVDSNGVHGVRVLGQGGLSLPWDPVLDAQASVISVAQPTNWCLSDERAISALSAVSVVHASLQGTITPSGLVAGPVDAAPRYRIVNPGNQISFLFQ